MERYGNERVEEKVGSPEQKLEQTIAKRLGKKVVALEFQRRNDFLERAAVAAPGIQPFQDGRICRALDADERIPGSSPRPRGCTGAALRLVDPRAGAPAGRATGTDARLPFQFPLAGDAPGRQNDSRGLSSNRGQCRTNEASLHPMIVLAADPAARQKGPAIESPPRFPYIDPHETTASLARSRFLSIARVSTVRAEQRRRPDGGDDRVPLG